MTLAIENSSDVDVSEEVANAPAHELVEMLDRLEHVLECENNALLEMDQNVWPTMNVRKERCLLELTRGMSSLPEDDAEKEQLRIKINDMTPILDRNRTLLSNQLDAAREVSKTIITAISEAESDGTYNANVALDQGNSGA